MDQQMHCEWDILIDRRQTHCIKWDAMGEFIGKADLQPFWVADMDFRSPQAVAETLKARAEQGVFGYPKDDVTALEAFVSWVARRHGLRVSPSWIVRTPGVVTAIGLAIQTYTQPGDAVLIQTPVYPQFSEMTLLNERRLIQNPLDLKSGRAEVDFENLEALFDRERPKMMIFCNPHNPLGRVWDEAVVARILELCCQYEVLLFSDEIHSDLLFEGVRFQSALCGLEASSEQARWVLSAMAPSKTFNIAGLFYSLILIPDEDRRKAFEKTMQKLHLTAVNCLNEPAAKAAYACGEPWLDALLPYLEANYQFLKAYLAEQMPEVKLCEMEGTYLAWLDFRAWFENGYQLKRFMIDRAGLALSDGRAFGSEGEGFVRLNFGCPRSELKAGLDKILTARREMLTE